MNHDRQTFHWISLVRRMRHALFADPLFPAGDVERRRFMLRNLILHFRPVSVPRSTLRFSLTWALGGTAVVLVLLQVATGVLLKFVYEPTPVSAYTSIQVLVSHTPFGRLIRNMHHWSAHLLVLVVFLHFLRVFFTGAFHAPRQFNWIIGLGQFLLILLANFTGYLLPWDQLAFWAVTVSTAMLAYVPLFGPFLQNVLLTGTDLGPGTLQIFFAMHTAVLPALILLMMGFHFWRIRKAGGLVIPRPPDQAPVSKPERVSTLPNLLLREMTAALILIAGLLLFSIFINAPLGDPANPGLSPNPTKAPWYFAGLQELLLQIHPVFAICVIPLTFVTLLIALPYLKYDSDSRGIWFVSASGRRQAAVAAAAGAVATAAVIVLKEKILPAAEGVFYGGVVPYMLLMACLLLVYLYVKRVRGGTRNEAVQALFAMLVASFAMLTAVNVWFRGPAMALILPF
jgi:quinol-cytochrome oxidoreductase complex cytochrome b subunit